MKYLLTLLLLGCAESQRTEVTLTNQTDRKIAIEAQADGFGRTIELEPGAEWQGWIPRGSGAKTISVKVRSK